MYIHKTVEITSTYRFNKTDDDLVICECMNFSVFFILAYSFHPVKTTLNDFLLSKCIHYVKPTHIPNNVSYSDST